MKYRYYFVSSGNEYIEVPYYISEKYDFIKKLNNNKSLRNCETIIHLYPQKSQKIIQDFLEFLKCECIRGIDEESYNKDFLENYEIMEMLIEYTCYYENKKIEKIKNKISKMKNTNTKTKIL